MFNFGIGTKKDIQTEADRQTDRQTGRQTDRQTDTVWCQATSVDARFRRGREFVRCARALARMRWARVSGGGVT